MFRRLNSLQLTTDSGNWFLSESKMGNNDHMKYQYMYSKLGSSFVISSDFRDWKLKIKCGELDALFDTVNFFSYLDLFCE